MPYLETPPELAEWLADKAGVYGACDDTCKEGGECRPCWATIMADRIRAAVANEARLAPKDEI